MKKRIGCLTTSGLISALVTLIFVTGLTLAQGNHLFSPGPLSNQTEEPKGGVNSHFEIGGNCSLCHTAPWEKLTMAEQCVKCHKNIGGQLDDFNSLHGIIFNNNSSLECRFCHPEHKGILAPLTVLRKFNFPHEILGFSLNRHKLNWAGQEFECQDCHQSDYYYFDQNSCKICHSQKNANFVQAHIIDFGSDCLACHDGLETYGKSFNHDDFHFKLTGDHAEVLCKDCHIEAQSKLDLQSTPQDCFACHQLDDIHTGRLGTACDDCHTSEGWKPAKFDHNLAQFKLEGKHIPVECDKCHESSKYQGTPQDCVSCHEEDDEHKGDLGSDCALCHSANGWKPSLFDHAQSTYPLTGLHIPVACEKCHPNKIFKGIPTECYGCHSENDKHDGLYGTNCSVCHTTGGWLPSTFNHALNRFPLTGAHLGLACTRCHYNYNFQSASTLCVSCHAEPVFHAGSFGTDCVTCHTTTNWFASYSGPHPSFEDHGGINHEGASCRDCHTVNLKSATCTKCHRNNNPDD